VQDTNCISHFNISPQGHNRTDQFLESICDQLINRYQLPHNSLPPNATRDGEFFHKLLEESAEKRNGQSIIIAVDALDEVNQGSYRGSLENILFLPPYLPDDVYFILTKRRGVDIPFMVYTPFKELSLLDYQSDSERDVRAYIQNRINSSGELRLQIAERGETTEDFINKISDKSENNFMYLRFILPNIEKGKYKKDLTLEEFPQGLEGYYEFHWQRMGMTKKPLPIIKIKIIYLLTENYEPVSLGLLAKYASHSSSKNISKILIQDTLDEDELSQFLHRQEIEEEICYRVYHSSFIDFLHRKDIVKAAGIEITEIHRSIADTLWEGLYGEVFTSSFSRCFTGR
jgi:serine/threonine-protein kinase